jgi:hypothetical protein
VIVRRYVDYRVALLAVFLGLLATLGLGLSAAVGLLVFAGALAVGIATTALAERPADRPAGAVRGSTRQAELLGAIEGTVAQLEQLAASDLVPAVRSQAEEAVTLAHSALGTARTVSRAADQLDTATRQLQDVGRAASDDGAVGRLRSRQGALIQRLSSTADQLLDVYGNLVETNATLATSTFTTGTVLGSGDAEALASVSTSLDDLRVIAAELEATGRRGLPEAPGPGDGPISA